MVPHSLAIWGYHYVMRDSLGHILWVKGGPIGNSDAIHVEIGGLLKGVRLIKRKDTKDCIVEGDSFIVITWGRRGDCNLWRMHHYIVEIETLLKEMNVELHHVLRSQNSLADKIAKWSVGYCHEYEVDHMPEC